MNDHLEGMQLVIGTLLITCGIVTVFVLLIGGRRVLETLREIAHVDVTRKERERRG